MMQVPLRLLAISALLLAACRSEPTTTAVPDTPTSAAAPQRDQPQPDEPTNPTMQDPPPEQQLATATLGAGCFWCIEAVLERIDGVLEVESGYAGGATENPTYKQICTGTTGHAEVVRVRFDPAKISYRELLDWFFQAHDPTTLNRQGNDVGTQYRSAIFFHDEEQRRTAEAAKAAAAEHWPDPIVTEITQAPKFWPAEDYHQDYFEKNPANAYCRAVIPPKLKKLGLDGKPK